MENKIIFEINNYRRIMGLPLIQENHLLIINEQDELDTNKTITPTDLINDTQNSEINKLLSRTNKTIDEIINSEYLTTDEILILFEISKIKNLNVYQNLLDSLSNSEEYKNAIKDEYLKLIDSYGDKLKSQKDVPEYKYASIIYNMTLIIAKQFEAKFKNSTNIIMEFYNENIIQKWDDYDLTGYSLEYSKHIFDDIDFYSLETPSSNYSGWKIYIYAEKTYDVIKLLQLLENTLKSNKVIFKAATLKELNKNSNKGLIIYLPYDMVKDGSFKQFFSSIESAISSYTKSGSIDGAKGYSNKIYYVYEFNKKFKNLPKNGVTPNEINKYYVPNVGGDYMKELNQPDLFLGDNEVKQQNTKKNEK
jgi:hypothetical protein